MGYEPKSKAYRLYDVERNKVILSCDVKFDENVIGGNIFYNNSEPKFHENNIDISMESLNLNDDITSNPTPPTNNTNNTDDNNYPKRKRHDSSYDDDDSDYVPNDNEENQDSTYEYSRRSSRKRIPPTEFWKASANNVEYSDMYEPKTYKQATKCDEKLHWIESMQEEWNSLISRNVFQLTTLPKGKTSIGCKWVYKIKRLSDGSIERYKSRLVAKGYNQKYLIDYEETFAPVVKYVTIRLIIGMSTANKWKRHMESDCWHKRSTMKKKSNYNKKNINHVRSRKQYSSSSEDDDSDEFLAFSASVNSTTIEENKYKWAIDSGACNSSHLQKQRSI
jgi:hypothetical protein